MVADLREEIVESFHFSGDPLPNPPLTQHFLLIITEQNVGLGEGQVGGSQKRGMISSLRIVSCNVTFAFAVLRDWLSKLAQLPPTNHSKQTDFLLISSGGERRRKTKGGGTPQRKRENGA